MHLQPDAFVGKPIDYRTSQENNVPSGSLIAKLLNQTSEGYEVKMKNHFLYCLSGVANFH